MQEDNSLNIKNAIEESLKHCDPAFIVPSNKTARIQEVHITTGHALIEYVETRLIEEGLLSLK